MFATVLLVGVLLFAAGALLVIADGDGLSSRMPTQLSPRSFSRYPMIGGLVLVVIGAVGWFVS